MSTAPREQAAEGAEVNRNPENLPMPVRVVAATKTAGRATFYLMLTGAITVCGYFIVRELMPTCVVAAAKPLHARAHERGASPGCALRLIRTCRAHSSSLRPVCPYAAA